MVCLGMFLTGENIRWRKMLIFGVLVILVAAFYKNRIYNFDHMSGFLTGLGAGAIISLLKRHNARPATPSALPDR
jgi:membrane associated rhomboid family serine protease